MKANQNNQNIDYLIDLKLNEPKEDQVEIDYAAINKQFKKMETILIQHRTSIQFLTSEVEKKNPWAKLLAIPYE